MFHTVLVANRGEIALRVFRTCRDLGIRAVAIHTDLDADSPHVREADLAMPVPSYLDAEAVVAAAVAAGADAVHPGYGFLSERAAFARAVADARLVWVGPSADVIERMGRKDAARDIAVAAGVPVVPSFPLVEEAAHLPSVEGVAHFPSVEGVAHFPSVEEVAQQPSRDQPMTYPVLVKAAAGGGGKGMRIVRSAAEYDDAVAAARRESAAAFGDDTLLIEKYVERGRHIEVQVLGDAHGNVIHLLTRECSVQRRHQKVIEEAPAPGLDPALRHRMHEAAVALARAVDYTNAGTVEFLLDAETGDFYFLEMNTRLQVEHPVTEAVCGNLDLVALQLAVAAGTPLAEMGALASLEFEAPHGHAIEARIYAEDAYAGFLPQAGRATLVGWPEGADVRVDQALGSGQVVSTSYDPMLGKVIVRGPDREAARLALIRALDDTAILGLTTNTGFLRELAAGEAFRDAAIDTAWLDRHQVPVPDAAPARLLAAWEWQHAHGAATGAFRSDGFRMGGPPAPVVVPLRDALAPGSAETEEGPVTLGARPARRPVALVDAHRVELAHHGQRYVFEPPDVAADHGPAAGDGTVVAPMPGTVLDVRVAEGQQVAEGDVLGVVEAMKMELALKAPFAGTVGAVTAAVGQQVALGAALFVVDSGDVAR